MTKVSNLFFFLFSVGPRSIRIQKIFTPVNYYLYSPGQYNCVGINPPAQILADKSFYSESRVSSRLESSRIKLFEEDETAWICQAG